MTKSILPLLIPILYFILQISCGDSKNQAPSNPKNGIVFSCDNEKFKEPNAAACFEKSDSNYMTIALRSHPLSGQVSRLNDPGDGLLATIEKSEKDGIGTTWYYVQIGDAKGWIAEHMIKIK